MEVLESNGVRPRQARYAPTLLSPDSSAHCEFPSTAHDLYCATTVPESIRFERSGTATKGSGDSQVIEESLYLRRRGIVGSLGDATKAGVLPRKAAGPLPD